MTIPSSELAELLRCPACLSNVGVVAHDGGFRCPGCGRTYRKVRGVPVMLAEDRTVRVMPDDHDSNQIDPAVLEWMESVPGYVLNLGAGATVRSLPGVVELEYSVFLNTSVVADAHVLPFKDDTFEAVVSYNTFEHLSDPHIAAAEILRVLKPGGKLRLQTAFLQPLHEPPGHFYDATEFGVRRWFEGYEIDECFVPENMYPPYALGWISSFIAHFCRMELGTAGAAEVGHSTLGYWREFWRKRSAPPTGTARLLDSLSAEAQQSLGFGFELRGRRPEQVPASGQQSASVPEAPRISWSSFVPASDERAPMPLTELVGLLRRPRCQSPTDLEVHDQVLSCPDCGADFPLVDGVPALFPEEVRVEVMPGRHRSNPFPAELFAWLDSLEGYSLNLGAGATLQRPAKCVELEYSLFRNTTVLGDGHDLPFKDETFDAVVCFNTFEHFADPSAAAREVFRILKPGGRILIQTAFLQPLHEEPYHFYNATEFGVRHWFSDFEVEACTVPANMTIPHMLGWLSDHILYWVENEFGDGLRRVVADSRLDLWARYWEVPTSRNGFLQILFDLMPEESRGRFSAGFEVQARKPRLPQPAALNTSL